MICIFTSPCAYAVHIKNIYHTFGFGNYNYVILYPTFFILLYGMDFPMSSVFENTILIASQCLHELLNHHCLTTALQLDWWIFPGSLV